METSQRINIDEPRWNQSTYLGRVKHFLTITNPLNILCSSQELEDAKSIVQKYRAGEDIPGLTEEELWRAKNIYDSAFHPDTGQKMILIGRMSAQVPFNMLIAGCMLTFYKSKSVVVFWQWVNQSFNALVNYTNRSGDSSINTKQIGVSYVLATGGACATALGLNNLAKTSPSLIRRFVPFVAVAAAHCINIPIMRLKEIKEGIPVFDANSNRLGESRRAARVAIASVILSRLTIVLGLVSVPLIMNRLHQRGVFRRYPAINAPIQVLLTGIGFTILTPLCLALFPQKSSLPVLSMEPKLQKKIKSMDKPLTVVYFNKGL